MPFDEPSNRKSFNTGLRSNRTTLAQTLDGCGRACKALNTEKWKHSRELPSDMSLPDELNNFNARFEAINTETCMRASTFPGNCVITLSAANVSKTLKQVNIHKAAGPDGLPGCVLRACADQLASVLTEISTSPCASL
jgi:hypothetical protein